MRKASSLPRGQTGLAGCLATFLVLPLLRPKSVRCAALVELVAWAEARKRASGGSGRPRRARTCNFPRPTGLQSLESLHTSADSLPRGVDLSPQGQVLATIRRISRLAPWSTIDPPTNLPRANVPTRNYSSRQAHHHHGTIACSGRQRVCRAWGADGPGTREARSRRFTTTDWPPLRRCCPCPPSS